MWLDKDVGLAMIACSNAELGLAAALGQEVEADKLFEGLRGICEQQPLMAAAMDLVSARRQAWIQAQELGDVARRAGEALEICYNGLQKEINNYFERPRKINSGPASSHHEPPPDNSSVSPHTIRDDQASSQASNNSGLPLSYRGPPEQPLPWPENGNIVMPAPSTPLVVEVPTEQRRHEVMRNLRELRDKHVGHSGRISLDDARAITKKMRQEHKSLAFEAEHRRRDEGAGLRGRRKDQRQDSRFNGYISYDYGGLRALHCYLMAGPCPEFEGLLHLRAPREQPLSIDTARPVPEAKPRKLNKAHKARARVRHYNRLLQRGYSFMLSEGANWNVDYLDELRRRAQELTTQQTALNDAKHENTYVKRLPRSVGNLG